MDPVPIVTPVAYASFPVATDAPRAGPRAALAGAWLLTILAVIATAFSQFELAQAQATYVGRYLFQFGSLDAMDRVIRWAVSPAFTAGLFGMFAAAAMWHWPRHRLPWAAALPVAAAIWAYFDPLVASSGRNPFTMTSAPLVSTLIVTAVQCGSAYAGTRCGRPVARWLAQCLLPPSLSGPLVALWI